jgi:hypothetical protein
LRDIIAIWTFEKKKTKRDEGQRGKFDKQEITNKIKTKKYETETYRKTRA